MAMTPEKASTLKLLREGIGNPVTVLESIGGDSKHEVRAYMPECSETSMIPVLFLITSLAFLEAGPVIDDEGHSDPDYAEIDGWTPADFLSNLRFEFQCLRVSLNYVRGRAVNTEVTLSPAGGLTIQTQGRGQSATRWLAYVQGRRHLHTI